MDGPVGGRGKRFGGVDPVAPILLSACVPPNPEDAESHHHEQRRERDRHESPQNRRSIRSGVFRLVGHAPNLPRDWSQ